MKQAHTWRGAAITGLRRSRKGPLLRSTLQFSQPLRQVFLLAGSFGFTLRELAQVHPLAGARTVAVNFSVVVEVC